MPTLVRPAASAAPAIARLTAAGCALLAGVWAATASPAHASAPLALALPMAWLLDVLGGEPRNAWHPVAWLGRVLAPIGQWSCRQRPAVAFAAGALAWMAIAAVLAGAAAAAQGLLVAATPWLAVPLLAVLLKPTFAWRMLRNEVSAVEAALADRGLDAARAQLARIVGRDVSALDAAGVREAALETLAENLNDSVVAPLFWFALCGLPGAIVYRFANTADAMWGYRGGWEWAGKWAARADDLLSWVPARLTALLLWPAALLHLRRLAHEAAGTPSPNGGWPMAALALRLRVRLRKQGVYALNADAPSPDARAAARALHWAGTAAWAAMALATLALAGRAVAIAWAA